MRFSLFFLVLGLMLSVPTAGTHAGDIELIPPGPQESSYTCRTHIQLNTADQASDYKGYACSDGKVVPSENKSNFLLKSNCSINNSYPTQFFTHILVSTNHPTWRMNYSQVLAAVLAEKPLRVVGKVVACGNKKVVEASNLSLWAHDLKI